MTALLILKNNQKAIATPWYFSRQ